MSTADQRYLLDTHTFLWMTSEPDRLGTTARDVIESAESRLILSVASVWEIAIKASLGKLELPSPVGRFIEEQLADTRSILLEVRAQHALGVENLPWHHRDPFDRLLVAQAAFEKLALLSRDSAFDAYPVERVW